MSARFLSRILSSIETNRFFIFLRQFGNQAQASAHQCFKQILRNITFIADQFAGQILCDPIGRNPFVNIRRRQIKTENLAAIINRQMQFEAVIPAR